jgi:hypothetical protein
VRVLVALLRRNEDGGHDVARAHDLAHVQREADEPDRRVYRPSCFLVDTRMEGSSHGWAFPV